MHSKKLPIAFFGRRSTKNSIFTQHHPLIAHNQAVFTFDRQLFRLLIDILNIALSLCAHVPHLAATGYHPFDVSPIRRMFLVTMASAT